jgi:plastocyanin
VTIKAGQSVKWVWVSGTHDVVSGSSCSPDGKFKSGSPTSGTTFTQKFDTAGTFDYFCTPHCSAGMTGQVIVQ